MKHSATAALAVAFALGLAGAAEAQSWATGGPTPSDWRNAVPGPLGPRNRTMARPYTRAPHATEGYGSSMPPIADAPLTSPDNPQAPLGAGGFATGGQYFAR